MKSTDQSGIVGTIYAKACDRAIELSTHQAIDTGIRAAMDYINQEKQAANKGRHDRRLRNTKLLIKNYRLFQKHVKGAVYRSNQLKENPLDILDGLGSLSENLYIESIRQSQQRTLIIIRHIDEMIRLFRIACAESGRPEEVRRANVIYAMYIDEHRRSADQIAEEYGIEKRTVYKDVQAALEPLSVLMFGIDSMKLG